MNSDCYVNSDCHVNSDGITENLTWQNQIKNTLTINGMLDHFLNNDKRTHTFAFQRLCDIFHKNTLQDIKRESSKLRTYSLLKTQIGYETYLSQVQNIEHRTALTKFRLSNHCLNIETGRHKRINKNNRFCPFCPNYIEDEKHSLLQCQTYATPRRELINWIKTQTNNFTHLDYHRKFISLLTNINHTPETAQYIFRMFYCREFLTNNHRNST